jgi:hypothetical protein
MDVIVTEGTPARLAAKTATRLFRVQLQLMEARQVAELESALSMPTGKRPGALLVVAEPPFDSVQG